MQRGAPHENVSDDQNRQRPQEDAPLAAERNPVIQQPEEVPARDGDLAGCDEQRNREKVRRLCPAREWFATDCHAVSPLEAARSPPFYARGSEGARQEPCNSYRRDSGRWTGSRCATACDGGKFERARGLRQPDRMTHSPTVCDAFRHGIVWGA